jgi:hypothetical protein
MIGTLMAKMLSCYRIDKMRADADKWCLFKLIVSLVAFFTGFCQKFSFGIIGENVTFNVRMKLYLGIIKKHQRARLERPPSSSLPTSVGTPR